MSDNTEVADTTKDALFLLCSIYARGPYEVWADMSIHRMFVTTILGAYAYDVKKAIAWNVDRGFIIEVPSKGEGFKSYMLSAMGFNVVSYCRA